MKAEQTIQATEGSGASFSGLFSAIAQADRGRIRKILDAAGVA
jgi:hypothetical protein